MDDFYREVIIDRYKNPQMRGELDPHDYSYQDGSFLHRSWLCDIHGICGLVSGIYRWEIPG